jgi:hypothetical protein
MSFPALSSIGHLQWHKTHLPPDTWSICSVSTAILSSPSTAEESSGKALKSGRCGFESKLHCAIIAVYLPWLNCGFHVRIKQKAQARQLQLIQLCLRVGPQHVIHEDVPASSAVPDSLNQRK